jgi:hypothetical protein
MNKKKCVIFNYIPHKNCNTDFQKWKNEYYLDLKNMYEIFKEILNEHYQYDKNILNSEDNFYKFCRMIFKSSSKYIFK